MTGNELLQHRQSLGLSRREFSHKLPFSEKTLQNFENLKTEKIPDRHIDAIKKILNSANELNGQVERHLKIGNSGKSIEFEIIEKSDTDNKTISKIASEGTSESEQKRVFNETENYLSRFFSKLPRDVIINIYALYLFTKDENVLLYDKFLAFGALIYFISPIDAIPDITPFVGFIDDIGVIALAIYNYSSNPEFQKNKAQAEKELKIKGWIKC